MGWYTKVSLDISNIADAMDYFYAQLEHAKDECCITGNIERASANMPGIVEHRFNQLQEIEAILEHLNI